MIVSRRTPVPLRSPLSSMAQKGCLTLYILRPLFLKRPRQTIPVGRLRRAIVVENLQPVAVELIKSFVDELTGGQKEANIPESHDRVVRIDCVPLVVLTPASRHRLRRCHWSERARLGRSQRQVRADLATRCIRADAEQHTGD